MKQIPWRGIAMGCLVVVALIAARSAVTVGKDIYYGYDQWMHLMKDPWFYIGMAAAGVGLGSLVAIAIQNRKKQQDQE